MDHERRIFLARRQRAQGHLIRNVCTDLHSRAAVGNRGRDERSRISAFQGHARDLQLTEDTRARVRDAQRAGFHGVDIGRGKEQASGRGTQYGSIQRRITSSGKRSCLIARTRDDAAQTIPGCGACRDICNPGIPRQGLKDIRGGKGGHSIGQHGERGGPVGVRAVARHIKTRNSGNDTATIAEPRADDIDGERGQLATTPTTGGGIVGIPSDLHHAHGVAGDERRLRNHDVRYRGLLDEQSRNRVDHEGSRRIVD